MFGLHNLAALLNTGIRFAMVQASLRGGPKQNPRGRAKDRQWATL